MLKKSLAILVSAAVLVALSCQSRTETTATTDTALTGASTGTGTTAPAPAPIAVPTEPVHQIDHYKFWRVTPVQFPKTVTLKGQFDNAPWTASTSAITHIGNPVKKNGGPILQQSWHLVAYRINVPKPAKTVTITNQFVTNQTITVTNAVMLLLPAFKSLEAIPAAWPAVADHYVCYTVQPLHPIMKEVQLVDQFDVKRGKVEQVTQLTPTLFCVPVSKNGGAIYKPAEHLTMYQIQPMDPFTIAAHTKDQFGPHNVATVRSEYLAVPTFKQVQPSP